MAIKIGDNTTVFKVGSDDCKVYLGNTLLYSPTTPPTPTYKYKWLATYSDSHTESAECNAASAITSREITLEDLVAVEIGDCVTTIHTAAFSNCSGLTSCTIGSGVTSIYSDAFLNCSGLTSIDIPNSVTGIGERAFDSCDSISSVMIGNGITTILDYAFLNCSGLTSITVEATTPPTLGFAAFDNTNNCPIYVPCDSLAAYQSAWSEYASRIQEIPT